MKKVISVFTILFMLPFYPINGFADTSFTQISTVNPSKSTIKQAPKLPLKGKRIVLDAGHGGKDPGAVKNGVKEKNLNMQFVVKLADKLKEMGATIIFTRSTKKDVFVELSDRTKIANQANANLFISIHHDSNNSSKVKGMSLHYSSYRPAISLKDVYVKSGGKTYPFIKEDTKHSTFIVKTGSGTKALSYRGSNIAYDPTLVSAAVQSRTLADKFAKSLTYKDIHVTKIYSKTGIRDGNLYVTRWTKMPSVLVELGFISNPQEVKLLTNKTIQDKRALQMAESIKSYFTKGSIQQK